MVRLSGSYGVGMCSVIGKLRILGTFYCLAWCLISRVIALTPLIIYVLLGLMYSNLDLNLGETAIGTVVSL